MADHSRPTIWSKMSKMLSEPAPRRESIPGLGRGVGGPLHPSSNQTPYEFNQSSINNPVCPHPTPAQPVDATPSWTLPCPRNGQTGSPTQQLGRSIMGRSFPKTGAGWDELKDRLIEGRQEDVNWRTGQNIRPPLLRRRRRYPGRPRRLRHVLQRKRRLPEGLSQPR